MKKIWDFIQSLFEKVEKDKVLHFTAGALIGALCAITFGTHPVVTFVIAMLAGFVKEVIDYNVNQNFDFVDLAVTSLGGLVIALMQVL